MLQEPACLPQAPAGLRSSHLRRFAPGPWAASQRWSTKQLVPRSEGRVPDAEWRLPQPMQRLPAPEAPQHRLAQAFLEAPLELL